MTSTRKLSKSVVALGAAALMAVTGCSSNSSSSSTATASGGVQLVQAGNLTVCTHLSYKPFEFQDSSGKTVGFDMDMADMLAKKMGVTVKLVNIDFASITSGAVFAAKKCDIAMGAITITDARKKTISFSNNYFSATQALLVKTGGATELAQLKGKALGVQTDTTGQAYAQKNASEGFSVVVFDDLPTQLSGLQSGRVQAIINDNGPLLDFAKTNTGYTVTKEFQTGEQYGFLAQKDNANATLVLDQFNEMLATSVKDGTYKTAYKKWFGADPTSLPSA